MIAALVLAAAVAPANAPDFFTDDEGCRWLKKEAPAAKAKPKRPPPFVVQFRPAPPPQAASAPKPKPHPKKKTYANPPPGYDAIGCDEGGIAPPPYSVLPPPPEFSMVPDDLPGLPGTPPVAESIPPGPIPLPDEETPYTLAGGPPIVVFGGVAPPRSFPPLVAVAAPVPELSTWLLMLLAAAAMYAHRRARKEAP